MRYKLLTLLFILISGLSFAQPSPGSSEATRGKLSDTLGQIFQAIGSKDFKLELTENDKAGIKQEGREFKILKTLRLKALLNLPVLIKDAVVSRVLKSGTPYGFRVSKIKKNSILKNLGVRDGDIVKKVNNKQVTTEKEALSVFNEVKMSEVVDVTFEREGREVVYVYRFV